MRNFLSDGTDLRLQIKALVLEFMQTVPECSAHAGGLTQADIFRKCGLDWGDYPNATSSHQQYWVVGLLRELEREGKIQRDPSTKFWRVSSKQR